MPALAPFQIRVLPVALLPPPPPVSPPSPNTHTLVGVFACMAGMNTISCSLFLVILQGGDKEKKKIMKASDKFKFNFDWDNKEDTSRDLNPLYNNLHRECHVFFGGCLVTSSVMFFLEAACHQCGMRALSVGSLAPVMQVACMARV